MLTEIQRTQREGFVGSSDAAAICGLDPYRSAYDVWAVMTCRVKGFAGNAATNVGTYMERGVVDWIESEIGKPINRDVFVRHADGMRACNLDGHIIAGTSIVVESKTCGVLRPTKMQDQYGDPEEGMDGVPQHVLIQTHHQAGVIEDTYGPTEGIIVGALIGFRGLVRYQFEPNRDLIDSVAETVCRFMERNVQTDTPPDGGPSEGVAKVLPRISGKTVPINPEVVAEWQRLIAIAKEAQKTADELKAEVIAALGDAEVGASSAGNVSYKLTNRAGYSVEPTSFRQLRFKAAK